jgi:hypothetical protein
MRKQKRKHKEKYNLIDETGKPLRTYHPLEIVVMSGAEPALTGAVMNFLVDFCNEGFVPLNALGNPKRRDNAKRLAKILSRHPEIRSRPAISPRTGKPHPRRRDVLLADWLRVIGMTDWLRVIETIKPQGSGASRGTWIDPEHPETWPAWIADKVLDRQRKHQEAVEREMARQRSSGKRA